MNIKNERFQLIEACIPPISVGEDVVSVQQTVTNPDTDSFNESLNFSVKDFHFSLPKDEIHSIYPPENATGNYEDCLGHITLKKKTFPWLNSKREPKDGKSAPAPWLALICLSEGEGAECTQMTVGNLVDKEKRESGVFFPLNELPSGNEKSEDLCYVVDIPLEIYASIMPMEEETSLLSHVKFVDHYYKCDSIVSLDGYFSIVVSNRFLPSGNKKSIKNTLHLVSIEGFEERLPNGNQYHELNDFHTIRMVSLYRWDVFSSRNGEANFKEIMKEIDSGPLAMEGHPILERGQIPLRHLTRTGEETASLYRGPLVPYLSKETEYIEKYTADGRMIYDPKNGIMDISYSAAWQLGRLLVLKNKAIATALLRWRKERSKQIRMWKTQSIHQGKLSSFSGENDIVDFWANYLSEELASNELIAPISIDSVQDKGRDNE